MLLKEEGSEQLCEHVGHLVLHINGMNGYFFPCNRASKVVILHVDVLGTWAHLWHLDHLHGACVVLEELTMYFWMNGFNWDSHVPGFLHDLSRLVSWQTWSCSLD